MPYCQVALSMMFASLLTSGSENTATLQDIRNVIGANLDQLQDIEFVLLQKLYVVKPDVASLDGSIRIAWQLENGWEKRTSTYSGSEDQLKHVIVHSWDGDTFKITEHCFELDGSPTSRRRSSGLVGNNQPTMQDDLFAALSMRSNRITYASWLTPEKASVVGTELIDGRNTIVVRTGTMQDAICRQYYLDLTRGGVPLKAEVYVHGQLTKTATNVIIAEAQPGLFLPIKCEVFSSLNYGGRERVAEYSIDVNSVKINQGLRKEDFQVEFEPRLPVWDDSARQEGLETSPLDPGHVSGGAIGSRRTLYVIVLIGLLAILIAVALYAVATRRTMVK